MEGPLEVKTSTAGAEEPIKSEPIKSEAPDRSEGAVSPPPNCSICLGKLVNTSFTDSCLHQFCFTCLLQWSKIKTECPLCKQTFKSIIHNVRSEEDYDQYHVSRELATLDPSFELLSHYRTTMTGHHIRPHEVMFNPEQVARRDQSPSLIPQVPMGERLRRRAKPAYDRRTIYRLGLWALPQNVLRRFRVTSADFYRREPRELSRLIPWLNRELLVLLNNNTTYVEYVLRVILTALNNYDIRSTSFRELLRPHFGTFTDHFVHELFNYARSNYDLLGYDQSVISVPREILNEYISDMNISPANTSTSSDDSDVRVLDEAILDLRMNTEMPGVGPHTINMPGPSTVGQAFQSEEIDEPFNAPDVYTISSDSLASDNDCEVIAYVKPRHERTPEIIELVSSDPEEIDISHVSNDNAQSSSTVASYEDNAQPSTSHSIKKNVNRSSSTSHSIKKRVLTSSSSESDSDSDSDYTSVRSKKYHSRSRKRSKRSTTKRRNRSRETRVRNRSSRHLSSSGESDSRKKRKKRNTQRRVKKRLSNSNDSSSHEIVEKKSRTSQYSTKGTVRVRKDLIKKETRYSDEESFSSDSSTECDETAKNVKCRTVRRSKRIYTTSSSDFDMGSRNERVVRKRGKTKQALDVRESHRKESRYKDDRQSTSRSSSASSYASQKEKRVSSKRRESQRPMSDEDSNWINRIVSRKREFKSKMRKTIRSSF
ncbi:E3 ubiquitin-protein ligase Topors [Habropoda laboriosa]|uniref:E3 ubiquitin-protein ligase Topors n=1 Tax=Habropoda laboriosa TaxID=597456 RepID=A0A0L7RC51_9HYME|nr:E3 ubiquitin-protein ligase Topors [Habropoda laboriosa]